MVLNLTQHAATVEQLAAGVIECDSINKALLTEALTFQTVPSLESMQIRAKFIASLAIMVGAENAMIGGAPFFMSTLENTLKAYGIKPCYAFSERVSQEQAQADGSVKKINIFKHTGLVWVE